MRKKLLVVWISITFLVQIPKANAQNSPTLQTGYIRLLPEVGTSSPVGVSIFGWRSSGVLVTEAGVPSTAPMHTGRMFADAGGPVNTGVAFANPNDQDSVINFYFTDETGRDFGAGMFTLPAKRQTAAFLTEAPFGLAQPLTGTLTFISTQPVGAIALRSLVNKRNEMLITTVPVLPVDSIVGSSALLIPHFAAGMGWSTQVVLLNPGDSLLSGKIQFFGQGSTNEGAQLVNLIVKGSASATFDYTIPPRSAYRLEAQQSPDKIEVGSVRITPEAGSANPSGLVIFSYEHNDVTVTAASVAALPAATGSRLYLESGGQFGEMGSMQTGLAIANPSGAGVTVQLDLLDLNGTATGASTSVEIPAGGHLARFAYELFTQLPSTFRGVLRISSPSPVGVVGLRGRYNERGDLLMTTTPPYDESSAPVMETNFAHFAIGGGYTTQLILLSTGTAQTGALQLGRSLQQ